ncbi:hypothetical protein Tco_1183502 [Tanacetum coccineum]
MDIIPWSKCQSGDLGGIPLGRTESPEPAEQGPESMSTLASHGYSSTIILVYPLAPYWLPIRDSSMFRSPFFTRPSSLVRLQIQLSDSSPVVISVKDEIQTSSEDSERRHMELRLLLEMLGKDDEKLEQRLVLADTREIVVVSHCYRFHYMSEVRIDRITEIETTQRQLEASQLVASESVLGCRT